jgi:uncharacterized membrane protein HdeD (DUF308 family)
MNLFKLIVIFSLTILFTVIGTSAFVSGGDLIITAIRSHHHVKETLSYFGISAISALLVWVCSQAGKDM